VTEEKTYTIHRTSKVAAKAKLLTRYLTWLYSFLVFVIAYFQDDLIFNPLTTRITGAKQRRAAPLFRVRVHALVRQAVHFSRLMAGQLTSGCALGT
jgi:hypothetical protein